jgi:hypothetical protein
MYPMKLPIITAGCNLYFKLSGLWGEGSPINKSNSIAKNSIEIAMIIDII